MTSVTFNVRSERKGSFAIVLYGSAKELGAGDPTKGIVLEAISGIYSYKATVNFEALGKGDWYAYCFKPQFGAISYDTVSRRFFPETQGAIALYDTIDVPSSVTDFLVHFRIRCYTYYGQEVFLAGSIPELGEWKAENAIHLYYEGVEDYWGCTIRLPYSAAATEFEYKYFRAQGSYNIEWEAEANHKLVIDAVQAPALLEVADTFRWADPVMNSYTRSAFVDVVNKRPAPVKAEIIAPAKAIPGKVVVHFSAVIPNVRPNEKVMIVGNARELGDWDDRMGLFLLDGEFPTWKGKVVIDRANFPLEYKYVIVSDEKTIWESSNNRYAAGITMAKTESAFPATLAINEWFINPNQELFKGLGVYSPIFSLRSKTSCGIGQYTDIKGLVDFCNKSGISMIQLLPINDTTDKGEWADSYPYRQVSCFALHPMYIDLLAIQGLPEEFIEEINAAKWELEQLPSVDYPAVFKFKTMMFKKIFAKLDLSNDEKFKAFIVKEKQWLAPYALYCYLRDKYATSDFHTWPEHSTIKPEEVADLCAKYEKELQYTYWIQYVCDYQFREAREYANEHHVILKGDLPIGVFLNSCEAWAFPENFHMNMCAGAPPDAFSADGQNWGFPTYNWEYMKKDNYSWWRMRLARMAELFQALRVDHVLGFFRIWEIPRDTCVRGMLGHFNPSVPLSEQELRNWGLHQDIKRYTEPYIRWHILAAKFGNDEAKWVAETFLNPLGRQQWDDFYEFKEEFNSEKKIEAALATMIQDEGRRAHLKVCLFELLANVILVADPNAPGYYQVRTEVKMDHTDQTENGPIEYPSTSWEELPGNEKEIVEKLYLDFTYQRQTGLWVEKAMGKLEILKNATNMLICAEDLGQLTDGILAALKEKALLSLRVQRMSKDNTKDFDEAHSWQYLSVCCPSTHDGPSLRGWWEENKACTAKFWRGQLWRHDEPWATCEPWISEMIIKQHLWSNSMWAVFLLQDLSGITTNLRRQRPEEEQINVPADPNHKWRYRYPYTLEEICSDIDFTKKLHDLAKDSHRI